MKSYTVSTKEKFLIFHVILFLLRFFPLIWKNEKNTLVRYSVRMAKQEALCPAPRKTTQNSN